jgi:hypothetical protein
VFSIQLQRDSKTSQTEKGNKAKNFHKLAVTRSEWLQMNFMMDVLNVLSDISSKFQSRTATISQVTDEIQLGIKKLEKLKLKIEVNIHKSNLFPGISMTTNT